MLVRLRAIMPGTNRPSIGAGGILNASSMRLREGVRHKARNVGDIIGSRRLVVAISCAFFGALLFVFRLMLCQAR